MNCKQRNGQTYPTDEHDGCGGILSRERALRAWFTRDADALLRQIDGLDIGWGGVQRWATARMPSLSNGVHLDLACGYATFLAQLGWRYSEARLVGLNIDFCGPHALACPLLVEAGVSAALVQADARQMPFADGTFDSVSCFLGLQDVGIGFGEAGVRQTLVESVRVLRTGGLPPLPPCSRPPSSGVSRSCWTSFLSSVSMRCWMDCRWRGSTGWSGRWTYAGTARWR